jgi:uncharacterized protein
LDILLFTIACLAVGVLAGFLGGLLGIGGGIVIVPALILLFDAFGMFPPANDIDHASTLMAVGTSLATIIVTSAAAARAQFLARMVDWDIFRRWALPLMVGGYAAGFIAYLLSALVLRSLIGAFLLFVSFVMLANWKPAPHRQMPGRVGSGLLGGGAGLISGLAGIGGGNVVVPTLVYHNVPVHRATATSSALGLPVALAGTAGYVHRGWLETSLADGAFGFVHLPAFGTIALVTLFMAPVGVRAAHRLPALQLRRLFGALLILVAVRMLWSALAVGGVV